MSESKTKIVFDNEIACPHCNKNIVVKKIKKLLSEAVKAEYEEEVIVEKCKQKDLDGF